MSRMTISAVTTTLLRGTVDVEDVSGTVQRDLGASNGPSGTNGWYRVPLKAGDKLRIKVVMKDGRTETPATIATEVNARTYIIEYLLVE